MVARACALEATVADALPSTMEVAASEDDCASVVADACDRSESGYGTTTAGATAQSTAPATSAGTASPSDSSEEKDGSTARIACPDQDSAFLLEKDVLDLLKLSYILQVRLQNLSTMTGNICSK